MNSNDCGPGSSKPLDILIRVYNHEVHIQRFLRMSFYRFHHRKTKRNIGYKHPVHHIHMKPVGLAPIDHFNVALQVGKIS
ncbi:hypothetical protein D3C86_2073940 [compost metagenome]